MVDSGQHSEPDWTPPYIAWRTLLNLIERLETNMPPQIDRTFLTGSNQLSTQTLNALKSLELIEDDGSLTEDFMALVGAGTERPTAVHRMLEKFYPEPVRLATINATQKQLEDAFAEYGVTGSTSRKAVSFFLKGAAYATLPLSSNFKTPTATPSTPRKRRTTKSGRAGKNGSTGAGAVGIDVLRTRYIEMLMKKIEGQDEMDDALLDRIENLLEVGSELDGGE